jgi:hypothetical protein
MINTSQTAVSRRFQLWATMIQHIAEHVEMGQRASVTIMELHRFSTLLRTTAGALDAGRDPFQ